MLPHTGSWGLPDFGITEGIGNVIAGIQGVQPTRTAQGGSQLAISSPSDYAQVQQAVSGNRPSSSNSGQVLAATNTNNNTSNKTSGGSSGGSSGGGQQQQQGAGAYPADRYVGWDPAAAQADWEAKVRAGQTGGGDGGQQDLASLISDMYAPALSELANIESGISRSRDEATGNVTKDYEAGRGTIGREETELQAALDDQSQKLEKSGQSAFAEAVRNLNSLFQGLASRFGAANSAGLAASEVIGQEYLRNQGKMRGQLEQGRQDISQETLKMKNYITDKTDQLESWKRTAIQQINENFQNKMAEIALRRGDIEANKTRDRIALLQDSINQARQITQREQDFKLGLAQFAVETMQNVENRSFTPQEIAQVVNDTLGQNLSNFNQSTSPSGLSLYNPNLFKSKEDELRNLNPLG